MKKLAFILIGLCVVSTVLSQTITCLPVKFTSFNVNVDNQQIILKWTTAEEVGNKFFTVQTSKDGSYFEDIINVEPSNSHVYVAKVYSGKYFRIQQTDLDGRKNYSSIVLLRETSNNETKIYPTVVNSEINVSITVTKSVKLWVEIRSKTTGILYQSMWTDINRGKNQLRFALKDTIPTGVYIVSVFVNQDLLTIKSIIKSK